MIIVVIIATIIMMIWIFSRRTDDNGEQVDNNDDDGNEFGKLIIVTLSVMFKTRAAVFYRDLKPRDAAESPRFETR